MDLAYDVLTGDDYEHLGFRTVATIENCPTPHHHPLVLQRTVAGLVISKTFGRAGLSPIP